MGTIEYLDATVGDIGRLITGTVSVFEVILGFIYFVGQTLVESTKFLGSGIWYGVTEGWSILKVTGEECWEFGKELVKAVLFIFYGIGMVFESFAIIFSDLKSFIVHAATTISNFLQDTQTLAVDIVTRTFSEVPEHISRSLVLIGTSTIFFFEMMYLILVNFVKQLVLAPLNVIQSSVFWTLRVLQMPLFFLQALWEGDMKATIGLVTVLFHICVLGFAVFYKGLDLSTIRRAFTSVLRWIWDGIAKVFNVVKNSRRILRVALSSSDEDFDRRSSDTKALCVVCQDETVSFITMPCKHVCLCFSCVKSLRNFDNRCPLCRSKVTRYEKVYIPL